MAITKLGIACALLTVTSTASFAGQVFKCVDKNGTTTYSAQPCAADAKPLNVDGRSPSDKLDDAKRVWSVEGGAPLASAQACVDAWRPRLKDPDSGKLATASEPGIVMKSPTRRVLVAEGRARNGFGGLGVQYFLCDLDDRNAVIGDGNPHGDLSSKAEEIEKYPGLGLDFAFPGSKKK